MKFNLWRIAGYVAGYFLFYGPVALFQRLINYIVRGLWQEGTIHTLCLRIPIEHLMNPDIVNYTRPSGLGTLLLLLSSLLLGPVFCGRLCPAGAFTEYLSKIIPDRYKINWSQYTEIPPLRYGMLAGFCTAPFLGSVLACSYCNFYIFDLLVNYATRGYFISFTTSMLLTLLLWLGVFGLFTKGGRGFCNFLCPVGAAQSLVSALGDRLPFSYRIRLNPQRCKGCGVCRSKCPMEAISIKEGKAQLNPHNCIVCGVCQHTCQERAISYGRKTDEQ